MAQPDNLIGLQINNFVIRRYLARGGMADVYVAENVRLQREVVLKVLLPALVDNGALVERFRREALSMARLQHNNIVQVYDTGDTPDGRPFIAMQYVRGGTLEMLLDELEQKGQVMTPAFALALARQVAAALSAAHAAGIIHRDLKPSNILLDEQRRPLLTDLGIAFVQDTQRLTRTDTFIGTPHYMSPEQAKGLALDARSDVYSLGVVLFEMLAGRRPFPGDSHWALIHAHTSVPAPALGDVRPGLPRAINQVVARCLEKDPARRYQTAAELAAALDRTLGEEGQAGTLTASGEWQWRPRQSGELFVERAGRVRPATVPGKRRPAWGLPLGLLVLGVVVLMAWWLLRPTPPPPATPTGTAQSIAAAEIGLTETAPADASTVDIPTSTPAATVAPATAAPDGDPATAASPTTAESPTTAPTTAASSTPEPAAPGAITARVTSNVFTRGGPGLNYAQQGSLSRDQVVTVLGQDDGGDWLVVQPERGGAVWVSVGYVDFLSGALTGVPPAATIPPSPTATPTPLPPPTSAPTSPPAGGGGGGGGGSSGGATNTPQPPDPNPTVPPTETPFPTVPK